MAAGRLLSRARTVPVLLDGDYVDKAERRAIQQECHAAHRACSDTQALRRSVDQDELSPVDVEHDADRDDRGGGLPRAAALAVYPACRRHQPARPWQYSDISNPYLSHDAGSVLRLAPARLFQDRAQGARRGRPDRWRRPGGNGTKDIPSTVHARVHLRWHLRLHFVAERVSLRADLSDKDHRAYRSSRRHRRTDPRRRVLLGSADGRSIAWLDPGGADLLVLC